MTLVDKAKQFNRRSNFREVTLEEVELALALARGEVTSTQVGRALGKKGGGAWGSYLVSRVFIQGVRGGWIQVNYDKKEKNDV